MASGYDFVTGKIPSKPPNLGPLWAQPTGLKTQKSRPGASLPERPHQRRCEWKPRSVRGRQLRRPFARRQRRFAIAQLQSLAEILLGHVLKADGKPRVSDLGLAVSLQNMAQQRS